MNRVNNVDEAEKIILVKTYLSILGDPELLNDYAENDGHEIGDAVRNLIKKLLKLDAEEYLLKLADNLKKDLELI